MNWLCENPYVSCCRADAELKQLKEKNRGLRAILQKETEESTHARDVLIQVLKSSDHDICSFCKNKIKCAGKACTKYREGIGGIIRGVYVDFKWNCMDYDYGSCPMMEETKCNGCFDSNGNYSGFELKDLGDLKDE